MSSSNDFALSMIVGKIICKGLEITTDEIVKIQRLLELPGGYDVGIGGVIGVRGIIGKKWCVEWEDEEGKITEETIKEFDTALEAAIFFVEKRYELSVGLDILEYGLCEGDRDDK